MKKFIIEVTQTVEIELDETKFTKEFMKEFREVMYPFHSVQEHAEHLAQLMARGLIPYFVGDPSVEGYGCLQSEMGVTKLKVVHIDTETVDEIDLDG